MKAGHFLDYLVVVVYLLSVGAIGMWVARRKKKTTEEYFLANRRIPAWLVGFSIVGTVISSVTFVALPGAAFSSNWRLIVPNLMVPIVLVFVVAFVVPFYRRVVRMSSYEYLEKRFGAFARLYSSTGFLLLRVIDLGFTMLLTAIAVEVIAGWDIRLVIIGIGLFTILYTIVGGIEAVIWTDVLQGCVLAAGAVTILAIILLTPEGGPASVLSTAYQGGKFGLGDYNLNWSNLFSSEPIFWVFAISGLMHFGRSYITEPNIVQRYLVARTDRDARRGVLAGLFACVPIWVTFAFIGSGLWAFYQMTGANLPPEILQKPDNILPYFIVTQLPAGLIGLILAAILSAANSNVSSDLNSVATVTTQDYFIKAWPNSSERARLRFGRSVVFIGGLFSAGIALLLISARVKALIELVITLGMIFAGGILGLFALGYLTTRATRRGAYIGMAICLLFILWATITGPLNVDLGVNFTMHPIMIGIFSHPLLFITGYLASLLLGGYRPDLAGLTIWNSAAVSKARRETTEHTEITEQTESY
jgi:solute:Na+ symporter, SSS family